MANIIEINIEKIIPYEFNNKNHWEKQINLIANSIKELWFRNPVILDKNNIIVAWHWRYEAGRKLWLKKVPCIIVSDLTEKQIKKYRLLDNKLAELSENNIDNIQIELDELQDIELSSLYWLDDIDFDDIESNEDREKKDKVQNIVCPMCEHHFNI